MQKLVDFSEIIKHENEKAEAFISLHKPYKNVLNKC